MQEWLQSDDTAALVAHREFIDLRTYVFQHGQSEYTRSRFYTNGIVLGVEPHFKLVDARDKPRKQRSDSYSDPLADNGVWKVFGNTDKSRCTFTATFYKLPESFNLTKSL